MAGFFQVDRGIFTSSIWITGTAEERVLWLWLLGNKDDDGVVRHRELAIADGAKLPRSVVADALRSFSEPDPDSRTGDNEGRRIAWTPEGFVRILNHELYYGRDYSTPRWRRWKDRQQSNALANAGQRKQTPQHVGNEGQEKEQGQEQKTDSSAGADARCRSSKAKAQDAAAVTVLAYWQERTGTKLRSPIAHAQILARIKARLRDGCSVADLKACVDFALADEFYASKGYAKKPDVIWRSAERVQGLADKWDERAPPGREQDGPTDDELDAMAEKLDREAGR